MNLIGSVIKDFKNSKSVMYYIQTPLFAGVNMYIHKHAYLISVFCLAPGIGLTGVARE